MPSFRYATLGNQEVLSIFPKQVRGSYAISPVHFSTVLHMEKRRLTGHIFVALKIQERVRGTYEFHDFG